MRRQNLLYALIAGGILAVGLWAVLPESGAPAAGDVGRSPRPQAESEAAAGLAPAPPERAPAAATLVAPKEDSGRRELHEASRPPAAPGEDVPRPAAPRPPAEHHEPQPVVIGPYVNIIAPAAVFVIGLTLLLLFKNETVKGAGVSLLVAAAGAFLGKLP